MRSEQGQATGAWVGLVLLGALAAFRAPASERGLGETIARRLSCAAAGACAGAPAAPAVSGGRLAPVRRRVTRARALDAFRRLRGAGALTKRLWIACLGYRRVMNELQRPRAPTDAMPLDEALETANACLNPAAFLTED